MHANARLGKDLAAAAAAAAGARGRHTAPGVVAAGAGGGICLNAAPLQGCRRGYFWSARLRGADTSGGAGAGAGAGAQAGGGKDTTHTSASGAGAGTGATGAGATGAGAGATGAAGGGKNEAGKCGRREEEGGAMSRRLEQMTDEMVESAGSGRRARKAVQEAGFSEDLKRRLEERIAQGRSGGGGGGGLGSAAGTVLTMPASAGAGTRNAAMAKPWTGNESVEDASLRMLTDAHKPLRGGTGGSRSSRTTAKRPPTTGGIDARMKAAASKGNSGQRLLNARDKTSLYAVSQDPNLTEQEKEDMRKLLRERFQPGARPMPTSVQGLASLANERIEDAIARGQFKNIARGKGVNQQVDYNANSPFLNTTEYFMNKMIQRQDIVPPWIEKQQEVIRTAATFRSRLRNDWRRHAARVIASKGGGLAEQVRRAEAYARAEERANPRVKREEAVSRIDESGRLTGQVNVVETPVVSSASLSSSSSLSNGTADGGDAVAVAASADSGSSKITVVETEPGVSAAAEMASEAAADAHVEPSQINSSGSQPGKQLLPTDKSSLSSQEQQQQQQETLASTTTSSASTSPISSASNSSPTTTNTDTTTTPTSPPSSPTTQDSNSPTPPTQLQQLTLPPFRDPAWESLELAYHTAALKELNSLTRSYNLMAPELAKRPYYSLPRELASCFADVAPQLAEALRERARRPPPDRSLLDAVGNRKGGVLERFGGESARVYDSKRPHYGFREFWRGLWQREKEEEGVRR